MNSENTKKILQYIINRQVQMEKTHFGSAPAVPYEIEELIK